MTKKHLKVAAIVGVTALAVAGCSEAFGHKRDRHAEWKEDFTASFAEADRDGSGGLDAAEFEAWMESWRESRAARMMARMDENGDGQITAEEMESGGHRRHGWRGWH